MFHFESSLMCFPGREKALVIFSGQLEGDDSDYGSKFELILSKYAVAPDRLIFIFPGYLRNHIEGLIEENNRFCRNISRFGKRTRLYIFSFDGYSNLSALSALRGDEDIVDAKELQREVVLKGVSFLLEKRRDQVIQQAPPGTVFLKPSKEKFREFIRTSELTVGYSEDQFLAFCVLSRRPKNRVVRRIFLDTSAISSIAEILSYYMYKFSGGQCKTVSYYSFGSHGGVEAVQLDYISDVWVIISASTSNNLGCKAAHVWGLEDDQILNILSYKDSSSERVGDQILVNISEFSAAQKNLSESGSAIPVRIIGENFTVQVKNPKQVMIKKKHKPSEVEQSITPYRYGDVFKANKTDFTKDVRRIYVDLQPILNSAAEGENEIESWVKRIVAWHVPFSVRWIIRDKNDLVAVKLCKTLIREIENPEKPDNVCEIDLDDAAEKIHNDSAAVVIVSSVISTGRSLVRLNRDLRISKHNGNRIFICPFVVSESKSAFFDLGRTLTFGPNNFKYQLFTKHQIFVGEDDIKNCWEKELSLVENFKAEFWKVRAGRLAARGNGIVCDVGVRSEHSTRELDFTQDFAFWDDEYNLDKVNPVSVFVTIAAILQHLREKPYTEQGEDSLSGNVYQSAVIDPDNFTRFDDPLIQACLWRAAKCTELDYSVCSSMSRNFSEYINRLVNDYSVGKENAALDLLVGIAIHKIVVSKSDLEMIIDRAKENLGNFSAVQELLSHIERKLLLRNDVAEVLEAPI